MYMLFKKIIDIIKKYFCFKSSVLKQNIIKEKTYIPKIKQFKK
jgi:hypothetical protein